MYKKLFLVRHADYSGNVPDPSLSEWGKKQSAELGQKIKSQLIEGDVTIWTSSAARASETAQLIKQELQLAEMQIFEKLWSDNRHRQDFEWLKGMLDEFERDNLLIVSHLEYVRDFPRCLGLRGNEAGYAQGIVVENGVFIMI